MVKGWYRRLPRTVRSHRSDQQTLLHSTEFMVQVSGLRFSDLDSGFHVLFHYPYITLHYPICYPSTYYYYYYPHNYHHGYSYYFYYPNTTTLLPLLKSIIMTILVLRTSGFGLEASAASLESWDCASMGGWSCYDGV